MNLLQFVARWPKKEGRLFFLAGGRDHDRLSIFYTVVDHWKKKVDKLDFHRVHRPSYAALEEACRKEPIASRYRVVAASELEWVDPVEEPGNQSVKRMAALLDNFDKDLVLIVSTPEQNPLTKNDFAQAIIRKTHLAYWVVLRNVDELSACELVSSLTGWDEQLVREVVYTIGTVPADLISFIRLTRLAGAGQPAQIRSYMGEGMQGTVFDLQEAIVSRDVNKALSISNDDIPTGQLLGALDRKFTSLLQFESELRKGRSPKEAALALRLPGFIVHGLYEASKRWAPEDILRVWPTLSEIADQAGRPGANDLLIKRLAA